MTNFLTKSRLCGFLCMLIGGIAAIAAKGFAPAGLLDSDPGPSLFPLIGGIGLAICGLIIFLQNSDKSRPLSSDFTKAGLLRIAKCAVLLVVYCVAIKYVGFLISTVVVIYIFCGLFTLGKTVAWWKRLIYTVLMTGIVYYVFVDILSVMLPTGKIF